MTLRLFLQRTLAVLAAVVGLSVATPAAQAAAYNDGDVFLCFRATGGQSGTTDYMVNLGPVTQFTGAAGAILSVPLGGDTLTDLATIYGDDWSTRGDLLWSISGTQRSAGNGFPAVTMFATKEEPSPGTQSTPWQRVSINSGLVPAGKMQSMGTRYAAGTTSDGGGSQLVSTNNPSALSQDTTASTCYAAFMPGGASAGGAVAFGYFDTALGIESTFANGPAQSVLDFYKLLPGSGAAALVGGFRMNADGTLTFQQDVTFFQGPATVNFSSPTYQIAENGGTIQLTINRSGNLTTAFSVNVNTAPGTGTTAGTDYNGLTNFAVNFAANDQSKTVDITILNRPNYQGNRSFTVDLSIGSGNAQVNVPGTATVNITETSPQPPTFTFSAGAYTAQEGTSPLTVTINRTGGLSGAVTVDLTTTNGTGAGGAISGTDFMGFTNQQVSFADQQGSQTVNIPILDPSGFQGDRTFSLTLSNASDSGTIAQPNPVTVTIQDNEANPAGSVAFSAATFNATAPNPATVTFTRSGGSTGAGSVSLSLAAGGTLDGSDFTFTDPTVVNFADGVTTATVNIPILAGASPLPGTIKLQIGSPVNVGIGAQTTATVNVAAPLIPDTIKPKIKLTSPKAGKSNATFDLMGQVAEADPVNRVEYHLNGGAVQTATLDGASGGVTPFHVNGLAAQNGTNTLLVQAFDNKGTASLVTKVVFTYTNSTLGLEGIYTGILKPSAATPPGGNLNNASGFLTVTVGKTGTFTGKVSIGGTIFVIGGVLQNDGAARFKKAFGNTIALATKGKTPVVFGDLAFTVAADAATVNKLTGTLGAIATVSAPKAFYDGKLNLVDPVFLANKGKFTGVFPTETQTPAVPLTDYPQGDGVATVTILKTGKFSLKGKLADGTAISASGPLSKDYKVALFAALYAKKGSLAGVVALDTTHAQADSDMDGANFLWLRPAQLKVKQYLAGWPTGITVDFMGAAYILPPKGTVVSVFPFNPAGGGNVQLTFDEGLLANTVTHQAGISATNKVTNNPTTDKDFTLKLVSSTGALTGTFKHSDGTKPAFTAIIYQKGLTKGGYGYFLSNPTKNGPAGQGGGVTILQH